MIKEIRFFIYILLLLTIVLTTGCCDRRGSVWNDLDIAESLMGTKPDSALIILDNIPVSNLNNKETEAKYALLRSMALDKNCIDTTTFDILQPAIDYYVKNGNPDEKLRTFYYQGRIYQNQGDDDSAMRAFMNASDLRQSITDSLSLAHTLVAQGTLYLKQYKTADYIRNNIDAAELYGAIGKDILKIKSYTNAIDGYVIQNNKAMADSLLSICEALVQRCKEGETYLFPSMLSYMVEFGSLEEIKTFLDNNRGIELTKDETINFVKGYSKIGECNIALSLLAEITPDSFTLDSLKYASVKIGILEKLGKYEQALNLYKDYSSMLERYQNELLSQDLLFSDEKHKLEMKNLIEIQDRDRIIWGTACSIFALFLLAGWLYYRSYRNKTMRIFAEKENQNLKLEQDSLRKEKEKAELECDKKALEAEGLEKDKKRLEAEQRQHELETANLKLEISQLESEQANLKELQQRQMELAKPIQNVIKDRLNLLNSLLAKEITNNESYAEPYNKWIDTIHNDKKKFMDSTRLAFTASHPKLMQYLEQHGLSTDEINYLCLYAIGLRGKEVGEYIQIKRHYIISHEIRMKLGIDEHETNIGLYIRKLMKSSEN